jgi:chaperonin GroES
MEKLTPLGNNVIVKPLAEETVSRGGIILPDTAKEKPQEGEIIAVGLGKVNKAGKLIPMDVKVGDRVIYAKYTGSELKIGDEKYLIMPESDILAVKVTQASASTSGGSKKEGKKNG